MIKPECISTDYQKSEKSHGRINSRRARVFRVDKTLKNTCGKWREIKCVVEIKRVRNRNLRIA